MRAFLMLVSAEATLTGFKPIEPEEVAMNLRMAGSFYRLHEAGESTQAEFDRCLQTAVDKDLITYFHEEKGATPTDGDLTIAMHWDEGAGYARFYMAMGPIDYNPKPSLIPPPFGVSPLPDAVIEE